MKCFVLSLFVLLVFSFSIFSQVDSTNIKTIELLSPFDAAGKHDYVAARKSCFSFINEGNSCGKSDIYYGGLRAGDDWDWLQAMGIGSRNKIRNLGEKDWTDDFKIPIVEPYAKLKEGEQRHIVVDTSGEDGKPGAPGAPGEPGRNGDEMSPFRADDPNKTLDQPVIQSEKRTRGKVKSDYQPYEKAVLGNMYVIRVVNETNDFYVLFRIDELERGKRCKISWKRIDSLNED